MGEAAMSMLDALIAQIRAAPNDDAPRLAWANAVGGERRELVIVQCRLASGAVTDRDEWRRLRARERELIYAHGVAWSGLKGEYPSSCMFRRGFVESAGIVCSYDSRLDRILERLPLARSVSNMVGVGDDYDFAKLVANPRSADLAALRVSNERAIERLVERGVVLRALGLSKPSRASTKLLVEAGMLNKVERLELRSVDDPAEILSAAPRLRALFIDGKLDGYAASIPSTVVELSCSAGLDDVARLAIAPTLERLMVSTREFTWDGATLISFEALRSLDLPSAKPSPSYQPIAVKGQRVLPALRELSLGMWFDRQSVEAAAQAFGRQLETLHWSGNIPTHLSASAMRAEMEKPVAAGDAHIGTLVDGEFIVGMRVPWRARPLEFGDDGRGPWFEGGGVSIRN
jgi:hypothetical protein